MKKNSISPLGLDPKGVGPRIIGFAMPFIIAGIVLRIWWPAYTYIPMLNNATLRIAGLILVILGAIAWLTAMVQFAIGFSKGVLITNGVFGISRNPIYVSWALFILPGLFLLLNNFWFFLAAVFMLLATLIFLKDEEKVMMETFGKDFESYSQKVGRIGFFTGL